MLFHNFILKMLVVYCNKVFEMWGIVHFPTYKHARSKSVFEIVKFNSTQHQKLQFFYKTKNLSFMDAFACMEELQFVNLSLIKLSLKFN